MQEARPIDNQASSRAVIAQLIVFVVSLLAIFLAVLQALGSSKYGEWATYAYLLVIPVSLVGLLGIIWKKRWAPFIMLLQVILWAGGIYFNYLDTQFVPPLGIVFLLILLYTMWETFMIFQVKHTKDLNI